MYSKEKIIELSQEYSSHVFREKYGATEKRLGSFISKKGTSFKVWSPKASKVSLNLFKDGSLNTSPYQVVPMTLTDNGIWEYITSQNLDGVYYTYTFKVLGFENECGDIYARASNVNGTRSMVVDLKTTNPQDWSKDKFVYSNKLQPIIYELHIKDFSYDKLSGVKDEYRGKYLAFTQRGTTLDKDITKPTCLDYIKSLGVTHIHMLPMYQFGSVDETGSDDKFNWGYDPVNYNIPSGVYATDPYNGKVRIKEMKEMIKAIHQAGMGVIMDVVYNHTYDFNSNFQKTMPFYYYRTTSKGKIGNGSGCGNETASERFMFRKFMVESILYWAKEYHLDGFRFDLMGLHDVDTMNFIRKKLDSLPNGENILMYGEPWFALPPSMDIGAYPASKENLRYLDSRIAIFSNDTRDVIKGSVFREKDAGYVNGRGLHWEKMQALVKAWCGSAEVDAEYPRQIISYVSAHDNFTLYDKLLLSMTDGISYSYINQDVIQANKLCASIYMLSCGLNFFQAGEEFARTKQGIGDSYNSPPEINMLDWSRAYKNENLVKYYRDMIKFRKSIPILMSTTENPDKHINFIANNDYRLISYTVKNNKGEMVFIVFNPLDYETDINLPLGEWTMICNGQNFLLTPETSLNGKITLHRKSCSIFILK